MENGKDLFLNRGQKNLVDENYASSIFYDDFPLAAAATTSQPSSSGNDVDVMELIDGSNEMWDSYSSLLQSENPQEIIEEEKKKEGFSNLLEGNSELAMMFLEWVKHNRDYISAQDIRSIKLKQSTIESASRRLGNTKEGQKQLLKLILEWVEQFHLHKKRFSESGHQITHPNPNPNILYNLPQPNSAWISPPDSASAAQPPFRAPIVAPSSHQVVNGIPYPHVPGGQFSPFLDPNAERMLRLGSLATNEAAKKKMARQQRRLYLNHRHSSNSNQH